MQALLIAPVASLLLLAAHCLRSYGLVPALACLMLAALPLFRRSWVPRTVQLVLAVGTIEWCVTTIVFVQERIALGRPWTRLALILGALTVLTAASALVFRHPALRARFQRY